MRGHGIMSVLWPTTWRWIAFATFISFGCLSIGTARASLISIVETGSITSATGTEASLLGQAYSLSTTLDTSSVQALPSCGSNVPGICSGYNLESGSTILSVGSHSFSEGQNDVGYSASASFLWSPAPALTGRPAALSVEATETFDYNFIANVNITSTPVPNPLTVTGTFSTAVSGGTLSFKDAASQFALSGNISGLTINGSQSCSSVLAGSVSTPVLSGSSANGMPTGIHATFTPNFGLSLQQAATACNVQGFDWQQTVLELPSPSPYFQVNNPKALTANASASPPVTFNDPPPGGLVKPPTCSYNTSFFGTLTPVLSNATSTAYPFYYNPNTPSSDCMSLSSPLQEPQGVNGTTLNFTDGPADNCLPPIIPYVGGTGASCGGNTAPPGSELEFQTQLVGIGPNDAAVLLDPFLQFLWTDTFNGCNGLPPCGSGSGAGGIGTVSLDNALPVDDSSGSGGITVIAMGSSSVPEPSSFFLLASSLAIVLSSRMLRRM